MAGILGVVLLIRPVPIVIQRVYVPLAVAKPEPPPPVPEESIIPPARNRSPSNRWMRVLFRLSADAGAGAALGVGWFAHAVAGRACGGTANGQAITAIAVNWECGYDATSSFRVSHNEYYSAAPGGSAGEDKRPPKPEMPQPPLIRLAARRRPSPRPPLISSVACRTRSDAGQRLAAMVAGCARPTRQS